MLHDLKEKELSALYDLLADYTSQYTLMMRWGKGKITDGFDECRDVIQQLQNEIDSRKPQENTQENKDSQDDGIELVPAIAWFFSVRNSFSLFGLVRKTSAETGKK